MAETTLVIKIDTAIGKRNIAELQRKLEQFGTKGDSISRRLQTFGRGFGTAAKAATVAVGGLGAVVLKMAGDFESGMNRVKGLTGATGAEFDAMREQAKKLGETTQFSASEAAEAMGFLAQAGFEASDIMTAMPSTLDLAAAGMIDLGTAADISSNIMSGFSLEAEELGHVNDVLAGTFTQTNTNLTQLGEAMSYVAPVANSVGISIESTSAAIGLLGNAGIQGSRAGTTLNQALIKLLDPSEEAATLIKELGINVYDSSGNLKDFGGILASIEQSAAGPNDVMKIFGARAGPGLNALLSQGSEALIDLTKNLEETGGTAERIAKVNMEGFNGAMKELKSALEGVAIAIGDAGLIEFATDMAKQFASFIREEGPGFVDWLRNDLAPVLKWIGETFVDMKNRFLTFVEATDAIRNGDIQGAFEALGGKLIENDEAMEALAASADALETQIGTYQTALTALDAEILHGNELTDEQQKAYDFLKNKIAELTPEWQKLLQKIVEGTPSVSGLTVEINEAGDAIERLDSGPVKRGGAAIDKLREIFDNASGRGGGGTGGGSGGAKGFNEELKKFEESILSSADRAAILEGKMEILNRLYKTGALNVGDYTAEVNSLGGESILLTDRLDDVAQAAEEAKIGLDAFGGSGRQLLDDLPILEQAMEEAKIDLEAFGGAGEDVAEILKKTTQPEIENTIDVIGTMQESFQTAIADMFFDTLKEGELNFKAFAQTILDTFLRLIADMVAAWVTSEIFEFFFGTGTPFNINLGNFLPGQGSLPLPNPLPFLSSLLGPGSTTTGAGGGAVLTSAGALGGASLGGGTASLSLGTSLHGGAQFGAAASGSSLAAGGGAVAALAPLAAGIGIVAIASASFKNESEKQAKAIFDRIANDTLVGSFVTDNFEFLGQNMTRTARGDIEGYIKVVNDGTDYTKRFAAVVGAAGDKVTVAYDSAGNVIYNFGTRTQEAFDVGLLAMTNYNEVVDGYFAEEERLVKRSAAYSKDMGTKWEALADTRASNAAEWVASNELVANSLEDLSIIAAESFKESGLSAQQFSDIFEDGIVTAAEAAMAGVEDWEGGTLRAFVSAYAGPEGFNTKMQEQVKEAAGSGKGSMAEFSASSQKSFAELELGTEKLANKFRGDITTAAGDGKGKIAEFATSASQNLTEVTGNAEGASEAIGGVGDDLKKLDGEVATVTVETVNTTTNIVNTVYTSSGQSEGGRATGTYGRFEKVPPGYPNDTYPIFLTSGEDFMVRTAADRRRAAMNQSFSSGTVGQLPDPIISDIADLASAPIRDILDEMQESLGPLVAAYLFEKNKSAGFKNEALIADMEATMKEWGDVKTVLDDMVEKLDAGGALAGSGLPNALKKEQWQVRQTLDEIYAYNYELGDMIDQMLQKVQDLQQEAYLGNFDPAIITPPSPPPTSTPPQLPDPTPPSGGSGSGGSNDCSCTETINSSLDKINTNIQANNEINMETQKHHKEAWDYWKHWWYKRRREEERRGVKLELANTARTFNDSGSCGGL
jgi:TP901 family phage tail tape measure protein